MTIKSELLAIQDASTDGILHCNKVVEWARTHPESALYSVIEWENEKAADEYRLWQVRKLIQLHIISEDGDPVVVSLSVDQRSGGGYRSVSDVIKVPDLREIMLQDALNELERMHRKFARVEALAGVWREVEVVRE